MRQAPLLLFLATATASPLYLSKVIDSCSPLLSVAGATFGYPKNVAHLLHDINLANLRVFKTDVTEENSVPTLAQNLSIPADKALLLSTPDRASPQRAKMLTEGMKTLDDVLSHLGETDWGMPNFSPLEKIAHAFHMLELRTAALAHYRELEAHPPSSEVCACAADAEASGIKGALAGLAGYFRQPRAAASKDVGYHEGYSEHYKAKADSFDCQVPRLRTAADWEQWKAANSVLVKESFATESIPRDGALFLYCALNH